MIVEGWWIVLAIVQETIRISARWILHLPLMACAALISRRGSKYWEYRWSWLRIPNATQEQTTIDERREHIVGTNDADPVSTSTIIASTAAEIWIETPRTHIKQRSSLTALPDASHLINGWYTSVVSPGLAESTTVGGSCVMENLNGCISARPCLLRIQLDVAVDLRQIMHRVRTGATDGWEV
ncbi:hypothetical protein JB92DRAFT_3100520 [Gautieria morchelliformis]|nr:hypothetical protein JB92DRAFT_3100520 [Gautieria morchelliformis]